MNDRSSIKTDNRRLASMALDRFSKLSVDVAAIETVSNMWRRESTVIQVIDSCSLCEYNIPIDRTDK